MAENTQILVPSSAPTNKAVAATGGSVFGAAVGTIVIYLLGLVAISPPDEVKAAIITIVTALVTLGAAYYTPPGSNEAVFVEPDGKIKSAALINADKSG